MRVIVGGVGAAVALRRIGGTERVIVECVNIRELAARVR